MRSVCLCVCIGWQDLCQRYVRKCRDLKGRKKSHSRLVESVSVVQDLQQLATTLICDGGEKKCEKAYLEDLKMLSCGGEKRATSLNRTCQLPW